jgi:kojibiose phosphorylase
MVARETFVIADQLVSYLRQSYPKALRALMGRLRISRELPRFREAARLLFVPKPDRRSGLIEQFEGYFRLREASPAELLAARAHPHEYPGAAQGLAVPTQVIKQADVVMMLHLFRDRFSEKIKQANWEYYEPRTEHGSSLSASAYALVAAEFGNLDVAYDYFLRTAKIDLEAKYKVYVGTIFNGGSHPAANGGAWMTAVLGFGGVADDGKRLSIRPRLPARWKLLEFPLTSRGGIVRVAITGSTVTLIAAPDNRRTLVVQVSGKLVRCSPGKSITVNYGKNTSARAAR